MASFSVESCGTDADAEKSVKNPFPAATASFSPRLVSLSPCPRSSCEPLLLVMRSPSLAVIHNLRTSEVLRTFTTLDSVKGVAWDPSGYVPGCDRSLGLLMLMIPDRSLVQVMSLHDDSYSSRINVGLRGIAECEWLPGNGLWTRTDFGSAVQLWDLETEKGMEVGMGKCAEGWFEEGAETAAVLCRKAGVDYVQKVDIGERGYEKGLSFKVATSDAIGLLITPSPLGPQSLQLLVIDSHLENTVYIHSLDTGECWKKVQICPKTNLGCRIFCGAESRRLGAEGENSLKI